MAEEDAKFMDEAVLHESEAILNSMPGGAIKAWPPPSMEVFVDDTLTLLKHVGWTTCDVLAFSFGAAVCQELLLRRAFTFRRVLFITPATDIDDGQHSGAATYPLHELLSLTAQERIEKLLQQADTRRGDAWLESAAGQAAPEPAKAVEEAELVPMMPATPAPAVEEETKGAEPACCA